MRFLVAILAIVAMLVAAEAVVGLPVQYASSYTVQGTESDL